MLQSHIIDGNGALIGVAVPIDRDHHVAADLRLGKLDAAGRPPLEDVRRGTRRSQPVTTAAGPISPAPHAHTHPAARKDH